MLLDYVKNAVWHAFSALVLEDGIQAPKSKLKVLVASLGTILDCQGLCSALEDFGSSSTLSFSQFESYLSREVFSSLPDSLGRKELSLLEGKIEEACWLISKNKLMTESLKRSPRLGNESIYKLFRVFCLLADLMRDNDGTDNSQVLLCSEEADIVFSKFLSSLNKDFDSKEEFECLFSNALFDFQTMVSVVELRFLKYYDQTDVEEVITELYEQFVDDIVKMGTLLKRGEYLTKFMEKMFVLKSSGLSYYSDPKKPKNIEFDSQTRIEEGEENFSTSKLHHFKVVTPDRVLHLATLDKRYRAQWVSALRLTLSRLHCQESYGRYLKNRKRLEWHKLKIKRQQENDRMKEMLEAEKLARQAAEDQAKQLAAQKAVEEEQRKQLEKMRLQLEKLLEEEIQAKKDEELVRSLQARILNEEWEKRDELEKLQDEQKRLLHMERNKSKTYLQKQIELEQQLEEAQHKLRDLEKARSEMDHELKSARLKNEERNKEILETRLKLFSAPIVEDEKIRRARRSVSMRESRQPGPKVVSRLPCIEFDPS